MNKYEYSCDGHTVQPENQHLIWFFLLKVKKHKEFENLLKINDFYWSQNKSGVREKIKQTHPADLTEHQQPLYTT